MVSMSAPSVCQSRGSGVGAAPWAKILSAAARGRAAVALGLMAIAFLGGRPRVLDHDIDRILAAENVSECAGQLRPFALRLERHQRHGPVLKHDAAPLAPHVVLEHTARLLRRRWPLRAVRRRSPRDAQHLQPSIEPTVSGKVSRHLDRPRDTRAARRAGLHG